MKNVNTIYYRAFGYKCDEIANVLGLNHSEVSNKLKKICNSVPRFISNKTEYIGETFIKWMCDYTTDKAFLNHVRKCFKEFLQTGEELKTIKRNRKKKNVDKPVKLISCKDTTHANNFEQKMEDLCVMCDNFIDTLDEYSVAKIKLGKCVSSLKKILSFLE